jgi:hypothetical protein
VRQNRRRRNEHTLLGCSVAGAQRAAPLPEQFGKICMSQIGACGLPLAALASFHERLHTY